MYFQLGNNITKISRNHLLVKGKQDYSDELEVINL